ncbi:MAG: SDR family oxidoreductase [Anaerolineales bacterium]|nr:SDR family oxidoreductase [Anaerolineales bacterium]
MKDYFGYCRKVCVITGAASGMGKAATEMLVDLGARVFALDMNQVTTPGIEKFIKVNLGEKQSIDNAFIEIPEKIDKFFGVAGLSGVRTDYHLTVTVNFIANKYITEEYLDRRVVAGGAIAYVTSTGGVNWEKYQWEYKKLADADGWDAMTRELHKIAPADGFRPFSYVLSKRCMNYYVAKKTIPFAKKNIRINAILPSSTDTGMKQEFEQLVGSEENLIKQTGLAGRLAESREMAEPLVFLNSDMASFMTGSRILVDYGDETLKILKLKKDVQNMPVALKIFNTRLVKKIMQAYIDKS